MKRGAWWILYAALLVGGGAPTMAAEAAPGPDEISRLVVQQMVELNRSLDHIAHALQTVLGNQKVDLLIKRIELDERRLSPLGEELRRARDSVRAEQEEIAQMEGIQEQLQRQIDEAVRVGADPRSVEERQQQNHLETMIEVGRERLEAAERRVIDLENDVARGRDRIAILDEQLQELLDAGND